MIRCMETRLNTFFPKSAPAAGVPSASGEWWLTRLAETSLRSDGNIYRFYRFFLRFIDFSEISLSKSPGNPDVVPSNLLHNPSDNEHKKTLRQRTQKTLRQWTQPPQIMNTNPQIMNTNPQIMNTNPQIMNTTPQTMNTIPSDNEHKKPSDNEHNPLR